MTAMDPGTDCRRADLDQKGSVADADDCVVMLRLDAIDGTRRNAVSVIPAGLPGCLAPALDVLVRSEDFFCVEEI
jgi:hypothetical protein